MLLALEPSEIPEEYRLLFDAPILAAYQYPRGGFTLNKRLKPLNRQVSLEQVGDRAAFETRVSNDGQAVTTATYFLKNRGHDHFEVMLEKEVDLWEAKVGGRRVIPITQGETILVPLPKGQNPNDPIEVFLKFAPKAAADDEVRVALPKVGSPLLLANWNMKHDPEYRLEFVAGNVSPTNQRPDLTGFARLKQVGLRLSFLIAGFAAFAGGLLIRWATKTGRHRLDWRNVLGQLLGWPLVLGSLAILGLVAAMRRASRCMSRLNWRLPRRCWRPTRRWRSRWKTSRRTPRCTRSPFFSRLWQASRFGCTVSSRRMK